jgi:hypothetical protein
MTKPEFLYEAKSFIFKEVAKSTNQLVGQSKTSSMIANLFVNLPITVEARFIEDLPKPTKQLNQLEEFVTAYLKHDDTSKVVIAFFYSSEKHLTKIMKRIEKFPLYFAYLYMREALKVTRLMNTATHYRMMSNIIKHHKPSLSPTEHYRYSIMANEYVVNATLTKLFAASAIQSKLSDILTHQRYKTEWETLSEMDILVELLKSAEVSNTTIFDGFMFDESNGLLAPEQTEWDRTINTNESIITDLGESVTNALASASRGTGTESIFEAAFAAKKVKTGWFKKLSAKFSKDVFHTTSSFRSEWSSLNIVYRHKFKSPKHTFEDHKLSVILSIDHSGSVSTDGLQKLFYLFTKHSKSIADLHILIHDTEIVKEFHIKSDYDIATQPEFTQALGNRIACGGTSHFKVFERISDMIKTKIVDPEKTLYISFSDNYSDIQASWSKLPIMRKLYTTIFLAPVDNPMAITGTMDIAMS